MGRRTTFFLISAVLCAVLIPAADEKLRYVPITLAFAYVALAIISQLDHWARGRARR
jgi:hypothetical protein